MKELYISPELNVLCFAPVERLANTDPYGIQLTADLNDGGLGNEASPGDDGDFGLDII